MAKKCSWVRKPGGGLMTSDRRFTILLSKKRGYDVTDLDTYNEASHRTLTAAKKWACSRS